MSGPVAVVEFCGETYTVGAERPFTIGRDGDLVIDENPFLHRRFLLVEHANGLWWLANIGSQLAATLADEDGRVEAWLAPGAKLPLVFESVSVWFTAGPTTYEVNIRTQEGALYHAQPIEDASVEATTTGRANLTPEQRLLLLGLAEPILRRSGRSSASIPSSAEVADRLGWPITKYNRKLDNVCQKLTKMGVPGLHGGPDKLAANRRARLVEYALAARLVRAEDLDLLEALTGPGDRPPTMAGS